MPKETAEVNSKNFDTILEITDVGAAGAWVISDGNRINLLPQSGHLGDHFHLDGETGRGEVGLEVFDSGARPSEVTR